MNLESIKSNKSKREVKISWFHLHVESKTKQIHIAKQKQIHRHREQVVAREKEEVGLSEIGDWD